MNTESPTIIASAYGTGSSTSTLNPLTDEGQIIRADWNPLDSPLNVHRRIQTSIQKSMFAGYDEIDTQPPPTTTENMSNKKEKRLVQVYVVDPHPDVPLDKSVLYSQPSPILTDATDQELFFQIDMKQILHDHNQVRVKTVDKEASKSFNKEVFLEPVRIRDLVMNILTIARF